MEVTSSKRGEKHVLHIQGRADASTAAEFEESILTPVQSGYTEIVLDLTNLDYIASAGLRVILMAEKQSKERQGNLVLCGLRDNIYRVFEISGILSIFSVKDSLEDALKVTQDLL